MIWATGVGRVEKNESCCVRYPADGVGSGWGGEWGGNKGEVNEWVDID